MIKWKKVIPRWGGQVEEPPSGKKDVGYLVGDKPPAKWENWFRKGYYEVIKENREEISKSRQQFNDSVGENAQKLKDKLEKKYDKTGGTLEGMLAIGGKEVLGIVNPYALGDASQFYINTHLTTDNYVKGHSPLYLNIRAVGSSNIPIDLRVRIDRYAGGNGLYAHSNNSQTPIVKMALSSSDELLVHVDSNGGAYGTLFVDADFRHNPQGRMSIIVDRGFPSDASGSKIIPYNSKGGTI